MSKKERRESNLEHNPHPRLIKLECKRETGLVARSKHHYIQWQDQLRVN